MLHYKVVRALPVKGLGQVVQPLVCEVDIHGIHNRNLIIKDDIGIVCHSVRYIVLTLEKVDLMVVDTYIDDAVSDLLNSAHSASFIYNSTIVS